MRRFREAFGDEERCWAHLTRLRWPRGFVCPRCGGDSRGYMKAKRVHECRACGYQGSVTAGTIFHKTRVPLSDWFWALYRMGQGKKGVSALQLSKEIGVSYPTAWLMQHKIRKAMEDREQRTQLRGLVELDEGYVGGAEKAESISGAGRKASRSWRWRWNSGGLANPGGRRSRGGSPWRCSPMPAPRVCAPFCAPK